MDHVADDVRKDLLMWLDVLDAARDAWDSLPPELRDYIESLPPEGVMAMLAAQVMVLSPRCRRRLERTTRSSLELIAELTQKDYRPRLVAVGGTSSPP